MGLETRVIIKISKKSVLSYKFGLIFITYFGMILQYLGWKLSTFTRFFFFWPPTPLCLHFLWYKSSQKIDFFDHLPPSSCKRSLWTTPKQTSYWYKTVFFLCKYVYCSLKKTCHQRKLRKTKCLLFNFWLIKFIVIPQKAIWQNWCSGQFTYSEPSTIETLFM